MAVNLHCGGMALYQVSKAEFHSSAERILSVRLLAIKLDTSRVCLDDDQLIKL